jgi:hypothetical protein
MYGTTNNFVAKPKAYFRPRSRLNPNPKWLCSTADDFCPAYYGDD